MYGAVLQRVTVGSKHVQKGRALALLAVAATALALASVATIVGKSHICLNEYNKQ